MPVFVGRGEEVKYKPAEAALKSDVISRADLRADVPSLIWPFVSPLPFVLGASGWVVSLIPKIDKSGRREPCQLNSCLEIK